MDKKCRWSLEQRYNYTQKRNLIPLFFTRLPLAHLTCAPTSKRGHSRKSGMNKNDKRKEKLNMVTFRKKRKTKWAAVALTRGRNRLSLFCNLDILHPGGYLIHSCFMSCLKFTRKMRKDKWCRHSILCQKQIKWRYNKYDGN